MTVAEVQLEHVFGPGSVVDPDPGAWSSVVADHLWGWRPPLVTLGLLSEVPAEAPPWLGTDFGPLWILCWDLTGFQPAGVVPVLFSLALSHSAVEHPGLAAPAEPVCSQHLPEMDRVVPLKVHALLASAATVGSSRLLLFCSAAPGGSKEASLHLVLEMEPAH